MRSSGHAGRAVLTKAQGEGTFVGYASTFETGPDLQGDVVAPGAFLQSIADWRARGSWPPLLWQHEFDSPAKVLGVITDMREDSHAACSSPAASTSTTNPRSLFGRR